MNFNVSIGKIKLQSFISQKSNLVNLLMLMHRFQILRFPGPEMTRLLEKCKSFGTFQKLKFRKIWQQQFAIFLKLPFLSYNGDEKMLSNQGRSKFEYSFALIGKTGHFWIWKHQTLVSRHKNCQSPSILTLKNEMLLSLQILTFRALKLVF